MVSKEKLEELKKKEIKFDVEGMEIKFDNFTLDHEGIVNVVLKLDAVGEVESILKSIQEMQKIINDLGYDVYNSKWEVTIRFKDIVEDDEGYIILNAKDYKKFKEWLAMQDGGEKDSE